MDIYGLDFTSAPSRRKPISCLHCHYAGGILEARALESFADFAGFEAMLARPGPWIAGLDFPFGQARRFIGTIGWPATWEGYVRHAGALGRAGYRAALDAYRAPRPAGDKEHRRATDVAARAISPQKLYGVPVGLMFFEGAPRLVASNVTVPHLRAGDPARIAVEAYPGVLARGLIGSRPYKSDTRAKQTPALAAARRELLAALTSAPGTARLGLSIRAPDNLAEDPSGDALDALRCAAQAAWAWERRTSGYGAPRRPDPLEGWIADPEVRRTLDDD